MEGVKAKVKVLFGPYRAVEFLFRYSPLGETKGEDARQINRRNVAAERKAAVLLHDAYLTGRRISQEWDSPNRNHRTPKTDGKSASYSLPEGNQFSQEDAAGLQDDIFNQKTRSFH